MSNIPKIGLALLALNGCASQIRNYNTLEPYDCVIKFSVVSVKTPNYYEQSLEGCLNESTLNGRDREVRLKLGNKFYILIIDPEFPVSDVDRRAAESLINDINKAQMEKKEFPLDCLKYRRITTVPNDDDGIYFDEIN